jgi:hypothetical protein
MSKIWDNLVRLIVLARASVTGRLQRLTAEPESGLDDAAFKAILMVGGAVLALAIIALITAFVNGYLSKLPS